MPLCILSNFYCKLANYGKLLNPERCDQDLSIPDLPHPAYLMFAGCKWLKMEVNT